MTNLYIIGNGFDLWHKLPTTYGDFYKFAKEDLDQLENYYSSEWFKEQNPWHDFENFLGAYDWHTFYADHNNIDPTADDFRPSFVYGLTDDITEQVDSFVENIKQRFHEWISEIEISATRKNISFENSSRFINFNYTSTLQSIYKIPDSKILHIHGKAESYDDLIFGHGETMEEIPELDENGDSNRTIFSDAEDAAKYPFYAFQKPVSEILKEKKSFFRTLTNMQKITVIGHSLNKIDLPYFKEIAKRTPNSSWLICTYRDQEKENYLRSLSSCSVLNKKIRFCRYEDLESSSA